MLREKEEKERGGAEEGPASPLGVSLFITGLIPSCLSSHLRGHQGNQAQGKACRATTAEVGGEPGSLQTNRWDHLASHTSSFPVLSSSDQKTPLHCHALGRRKEKGLIKTPSVCLSVCLSLSLSLSLTHTHTHTHTHLPRKWSVLSHEAPLGPPTGRAVPSHPSTHGAAVGALFTRKLAGISVGAALRTWGSGTQHLEVLLSLFEALATPGHCSRAQPAWGAREQGDICERERQRRHSPFR